MQVGRRIFYDSVNGSILFDTGEMEGDVLPRNTLNEICVLDLPFGTDLDSYKRVLRYHVDVATLKVVFDELQPIPVDKDAYIKQLEDQLLESEGLI